MLDFLGFHTEYLNSLEPTMLPALYCFIVCRGNENFVFHMSCVGSWALIKQHRENPSVQALFREQIQTAQVLSNSGIGLARSENLDATL